MEYRSLPLVAGLILAVGGLLPWEAARAAADEGSGPTTEQRADWDRRLEEAGKLQEEGIARNNEAKQAYEARKKECFKKFRVTGCQQEARQQYLQAAHEARRIENEGKALERDVRREELADRDTRRLAREPRRQADLQAREAERRSEQGDKEGARAAKLAEKERQARIGAERRAADEERLRRKQESHDRKVAEKMEKTRRREAEAER